MSLIQLARDVRKTLLVLTTVTLLTLGIVCFTPFGFPYSSNPKNPASQRYFIMHIERTFHNKANEVTDNDFGFWIVPLDVNGPNTLYIHVPELRHAEQMDCSKEFYCGMPYYFPVMTKLSKTYYLKSSKPLIHTQRKFQLVSQTTVDLNVERMAFRAVGPSHMIVVLCPQKGVIIQKWSLADGKPFPGPSWHGRPTYFLYYSHGEYNPPWEFWVDLLVSHSYSKDVPILDVAFASHFLHGHDSISSSFRDFLDRMPSWAHITPWTASYDSYVF